MELKKVIAVRTAKTVYRDGDKAIKVFGDEYKKSDILNEALNQARVEETGIPMPKLIEVCKLDGKWAIVSDYIEGKTLQQLMDENPAKTEEYLDLFVDIQMSILAKTCPMLNKLKDKMQGKISQTDLDATTRYDLHTRLADELGISVDSVRNYFGGRHPEAKEGVGIHIEQGPDGGVVTLDDTTILDAAMRILNEK